MQDAKAARLFTWLDRGFWLIWLGFPVMLWLVVGNILSAADRLTELLPEEAACIARLPQVMNFSALGQGVYWTGFAVTTGMYVVLLALAHRVIHDCAAGRIFMAQMIGSLRSIGWLILLFPVVDLALGNLAMAAYVATGDLPQFLPDFALDVPVMGVGVLMVTMAAAMRLAARLQQDAALTI